MSEFDNAIPVSDLRGGARNPEYVSQEEFSRLRSEVREAFGTYFGYDAKEAETRAQRYMEEHYEIGTLL